MNLRDLVLAAMKGGEGDLEARQWVKDLKRQRVSISTLPQPRDLTRNELATCAAIVELLAERAGEAVPAWTATVEPADSAVYLDSGALKSEKLRLFLERDAPEPLRRRRVYAVRDYLNVL